MRFAWVCVAALAGCISSGSVECADGTLCPGGTTCRALTGPDETVCATPDQLAACASAQDGDACDAGWCHDGVCIPIVCGNARVDRGEVCDDGNTASGDGCSAACASSETCGNGVLDPLVLRGNTLVANEECDDGNLVSGDGCSSRCLRETPHWSQLATQSLPGLSELAMTYDPSRDRIVLFGGFYDDAAGKAHAINDVYEYNGNAWINVPSPVSPAARQHPALAYDGVNHRVVMFGGNLGDDRSPFGDTWSWDGGTWTLLDPATKPPARTEFAMAYDAARKRVVLFGGFDGSQQLDDTWEWDGTTWKQITTAHKPTKRFGHVMAYDPLHARIVIAGGSYELPSTPTRDTWAFDGTDWTLLDNATTPAELDVASTMAFDVASGRLIACTGNQFGQPIDDTTYAFNGTTWTKLVIAGPGVRKNAALAANPRSGALTMYGGDSNTAAVQYSSTYTFVNGGWQLAGDPAPLPARYLFSIANDPIHRLAWLFGGNEEIAGSVGDTWSYDGTTWSKHSVGVLPARRVMAAMAYDATHARLVMFGGGSDKDISTLLPADTWLHDGLEWKLVTPAPSPSPPPLAGAAMAYDVKRGRIVMFGGSTSSGFTPTDQTWEWDGTTWKQFTGAKPTPRAAANMTYDAIHERIVMSGGLVGAGIPSLINDVWTFDGAAWTQLAGDAQLPSRYFEAFAYDPVRGATTLFGGSTVGAGTYADTWSMSDTSFQLVVTETAPSPRAGQGGFIDPRGRGFITFDGVSTTDNGVYFDEMWRLDYRSATPPELCTIDVDNDGDGLSGCADPDCWATCNPLCPPGAPCPATAPHCGDGTCSPFETCRLCPQDCGACTAACGDTFCDAGETHASCPGDCP